MSDYTSSFFGSYLEVESIADRDSIPPEKRSEGMLVLVLGEEVSDPLPRRTKSEVYRLSGGLGNDSWARYSMPPLHPVTVGA